jgi:hypothetical protein
MSDDEKAHAFVAVHAGGSYCEARAVEELTPGVWYSIAGTFDASTGTVRLYVDDMEEGSDNACSNAGVGSVSTPLAIGSDGFGIAGDVDDVFLRSNIMLPAQPTPITCEAGTIAAFDFDDRSLATLCGGPMHTFTLAGAPADPVHVCR